MKQISRKEFLANAAIIGSLIPFISILDSCNSDDGSEVNILEKVKVNSNEVEKGLKYIDSNGAYLYFSFVNVQQKNGRVLPDDEKKNSYMIVQIPPQSLTEKSYRTIPSTQVPAVLARPSFLAFKLWPDEKSKFFNLKMSELLAWHDENRFRLLTTIDLDKQQFPEIKRNEVASKWTLSEAEQENANSLNGLVYYQTLIDKFFLNIKDKARPYISIIEIPAGLYLVPHVRKKTRITKFLQNNYAISQATYSITNGDKKIIRKVYERWYGQLINFDEAGQVSATSAFAIPPILRTIGLRTLPASIVGDPGCDFTQWKDEFFPTLCTKQDIAYLTQLYNQYDNEGVDIQSGTRVDKDRREPSPFLLTSSGATVKFSYYNLKPASADISLVEYEHHFQNGRDIYVRIANIGILMPSGEKGVYITVSKRKVEKGRSFMEQKNYVATLDELATFPSFEYKKILGIETDPEEFRSVFKDSIDDLDDNKDTYKTFTGRSPFGEIKAKFKESPPIRSVNAGNGNWAVWIHREDGTDGNLGDGTGDKSYASLQMLPFQFTDRNKFQKAIECPVIFLKKELFADQARITEFFGSGTPPNSVFANAEVDQRMRLYFDNAFISYTPDLKSSTEDSAAKTDSADSDNKINQLPTDYIEYYFDLAQSRKPDPNFFNNASLLSYFQLRRAKVYFDHFQHFSNEKLGSIVKMNGSYLQNGFDNANNKANLIIDHRRDFIINQWNTLKFSAVLQTDSLDTKFQNGYSRIKNMFANAGERIGPGINPGLQPERFGIVRQAFSLGKNVNEDWKNGSQKFLHTVEMFQGEFADILNGIPFKSILQGLLETKNSPDFFLNKIGGEITAINQFIDQIDNNIVKKIIEEIRTIDDVLKKAKFEIDGFEKDIRIKQAEIIALKDALLQQVPDYSIVTKAANQLFEIYRMRVIDDITSVVRGMQEDIRDSIVQRWHKQIDTIRTTSFATDIKQYIDTGNEQIPKIVTQLERISGGLENEAAVLINLLTIPGRSATELLTVYKGFVDGLLISSATTPVAALLTIEHFFNKTILVYYSKGRYLISPTTIPAGAEPSNWENIKWADVNWVDSQLNTFTPWGIEQLQVIEIQLGALNESALPGLTTKIRDVKAALAARVSDIENSIYRKTQSVAEDIKQSLRLLDSALDSVTRKEIERVLTILQLILESSPAYYYQRYQVLKKDYSDLHERLINFGKILPQLEAFLNSPETGKGIKDFAVKYRDESRKLSDAINTLSSDLPKQIQVTDEVLVKLGESINTEIQTVLVNNHVAQKIKEATGKIDDVQKKLEEQFKVYREKLKEQAAGTIESLNTKFEAAIKTATPEEAEAAKKAFIKVINLLSSIRRQELKYEWTTDKFQQADIGILKFMPESDPKTSLRVKVAVVAYLDPLHLGNVIERVETLTENRISNFSVTFLSAITIGFSEVAFKAGTGISTQTSVKIRDVKFEGALSFVQKLQEMLEGLGEGFRLDIRPDSVALSYFFDFPIIATPGFSFSNFAIGIGVDIYFDRRPLTVFFQLSRPDRKATVAAGIYGGAFFMKITADPKRGVKSIEMALELGAYLAVSIGPIQGEVRMMVGLYFKKDDSGVILEGYFVAEGILSVWILSVSARIYLGVRSQNSIVEGICIVSYTVKLGFIKKTFSGSFRRRLAGAESNTNSTQNNEIRKLLQEEKRHFIDRRNNGSILSDAERLYTPLLDAIMEDEYTMMNIEEWKEFYGIFFS